VGAHPFFYAGAGDLIDPAIELALVFKCDPWTFLDRSAPENAMVYERLAIALKRTGSEN
jgi:hypothetical protein